MKEMVASNITLFAALLKFRSPDKKKGQSSFGFTSAILNPSLSQSWSKRSWSNMLYRGQFRRKCSLSSLPVPQTHIGLKQRKLCLNLCPFKAPNSTLSMVRSLIPWMSRMLWVDSKQILFKTEKSKENFLPCHPSRFHSEMVFWKYEFDYLIILTVRCS